MAVGDIHFGQPFNEIVEVEQLDGTRQRAIYTTNNDLYSFNNIQDKDFLLAVNMGQVPGHSFMDKYGANKDIDTGTVPEDVWGGGGLYPYDADGTAPIVSLVSDSASDTMDINVQGLDIDGEFVSQTITLTGSTRVALTTPLWRVYRMSNENSVDAVGTIYCYTWILNVPPSANIRALIKVGNGQTLMALFTIPKGKVGYLIRGEFGAIRNRNSGEIEAGYFSRRLGKVFKIKKAIGLVVSGSSIYQDKRSAPDVIPSFTDVRLTVLDVSANDIAVWGTLDVLLVDETLFPVSYLEAIGQPGY